MRNETNTTQTAASCQSTRLGYRLSFVGEAAQPEHLWVCVRDGARRSVSDAECAECARWEASQETAAPRAVAGRVFTSPIWQD